MNLKKIQFLNKKADDKHPVTTSIAIILLILVIIVAIVAASRFGFLDWAKNLPIFGGEDNSFVNVPEGQSVPTVHFRIGEDRFWFNKVQVYLVYSPSTPSNFMMYMYTYNTWGDNCNDVWYQTPDLCANFNKNTKVDDNTRQLLREMMSQQGFNNTAQKISDFAKQPNVRTETGYFKDKKKMDGRTYTMYALESDTSLTIRKINTFFKV